MVIIMLTFQRMYLTSALMDTFGMLAFFAFVYFLCLTVHGKHRILYGILAGTFALITCSLRMAHLVGVIGFVVYYLVRAIVKKEKLKKVIPGMLLGVLAFLILCIPQFMINTHRNSYSLLPPNTDGILFGQSATTWSSDYAMAHGNIAYPLLATDDQMLTMKVQHYDNDVPLTRAQILDVYADSPMDTLMVILKRALIGYDQKTNIAFPGDNNVPWRETKGMLFSLGHYFLLFSGFFALAWNKSLSKHEKWVAWLMLLLLVLPETFMKIEWRYILPGYFIIYYLFTFAFVDPVLVDKEKRIALLEKTYYLILLCVFMFLYLMMSFTFLA